MPLHLLGKKSWNVYNQDNVDRVRRDEANAQADEQEAERRRKDDEDRERLGLLRGEQTESTTLETGSTYGNKRKRGSEDDSAEQQLDERASKHSRSRTDAGDRRDGTSSESTKANVTHESLDKITNMRFRDAAGRRAREPWYNSKTSGDAPSEVGRDVWGNEDAGRQSRDQKRLDANDPLLAIKKGVKQLKDGEKLRSEWRREREKDLYGVEELARKERHRRRKEDKHKRDRERHRSRNTDHARHGRESDSREISSTTQHIG